MGITFQPGGSAGGSEKIGYVGPPENRVDQQVLRARPIICATSSVLAADATAPTISSAGAGSGCTVASEDKSMRTIASSGSETLETMRQAVFSEIPLSSRARAVRA